MSKSIQHIAVVSINRDKYSETFIHGSFDFFPCGKTLLYGGYFPTHSTNDWKVEGKPISPAKPSFWKRAPKTQGEQEMLNLRAWLQQNKPDVVLAHYGPSGVAMMALCTELRIPLVVHFHGYDAYRADILASYGQEYPPMFAQVQHFVVPSRHMAAQLTTLGAPSDKVVIHSYCADGSIFHPQPLLPIPFKFLFVGRFVPKKSPDQVIRAFAKVLSEVADSQLVMVGEGELLAECQALAAQLDLGNAVRFLGVLPPVEVAQVLGECHALVLPSRLTADGDSEGTPVVLLEAGAVGRPVIGTDHAGIPDVIRDGENGLLIPQNDENALKTAMLRLAQDPQLVAQMAANAVKVIADGYSPAHYHNALWQTLQNACDIAKNS